MIQYYIDRTTISISTMRENMHIITGRSGFKPESYRITRTIVEVDDIYIIIYCIITERSAVNSCLIHCRITEKDSIMI